MIKGLNKVGCKNNANKSIAFTLFAYIQHT